MRRTALDIVNSISNYLEGNAGIAMPPTNIASKTKLNYLACKEYLNLIESIQKLPKINSIKTKTGKLFKVEKMTEMPLEQQKKLLKEEFDVKPSRADEIYIELLERKAFNEKSAIKIERSETIEKGLKFKHLKQTKKGRIHLTKLGRIIAKGAKELFAED